MAELKETRKNMKFWGTVLAIGSAFAIFSSTRELIQARSLERIAPRVEGIVTEFHRPYSRHTAFFLPNYEAKYSYKWEDTIYTATSAASYYPIEMNVGEKVVVLVDTLHPKDGHMLSHNDFKRGPKNMIYYGMFMLLICLFWLDHVFADDERINQLKKYGWRLLGVVHQESDPSAPTGSKFTVWVVHPTTGAHLKLAPPMIFDDEKINASRVGHQVVVYLDSSNDKNFFVALDESPTQLAA